jgi:mono/diheme cytochrome c family protein
VKITRRVPRYMALALLGCAAACQQSQPPATGGIAPARPADRGAVLYAQNCLPCHRENGEGVPTVYPSLKGSAAVNGDPAELAQWVLSQRRPASIPTGRYPTQMLLFGWMKDEDAAALLTYIRANFGNTAPPIDAAAVARARER